MSVTFKRGAMLSVVWLGGVAVGGVALHLIGGADNSSEPGAAGGSDDRVALTEPVRVLPPAGEPKTDAEKDGGERGADERSDAGSEGDRDQMSTSGASDDGGGSGAERPAIDPDDLVPAALGDAGVAEREEERAGTGGADGRPADSGGSIAVEGSEPTDAEAERIRAEAERLGDRAAELIEKQTADPIRSLSSSLGELREIVGSIGSLRSRLKELKPRDGLNDQAERLDGLAAEMKGYQQSSIDLHRRLLEVFKQNIAPIPEEGEGEREQAEADGSGQRETEAEGETVADASDAGGDRGGGSAEPAAGDTSEPPDRR